MISDTPLLLYYIIIKKYIVFMKFFKRRRSFERKDNEWHSHTGSMEDAGC